MRILFAGTPPIAVPSLAALSDKFDVVGVLTAPDRPSGRSRKPRPSPIKAIALERGISVVQPPRLGGEARTLVAALRPEILVVFAYGRIFGPLFLDLFPLGGINLHPSALPRFRGPSPITAAILAGDRETAMTVQRVALEMDAGDILHREPMILTGSETTGSLTERVAREAPSVLIRVLERLETGTVEGTPQGDRGVSYCRLIAKDDGCIDWTRPAVDLERMVRAYDPWPRAQTTMAGQTLAVLEASVVPRSVGGAADYQQPGTVAGVDEARGILVHTGEGILGITRLQLASRKPLAFRSFLNGVPLVPGSILGDDT